MSNETDVKLALASAITKCDASGVRFTNKRQEILKILLEAGESLSAYDVVDRYNQAHEKSMQPMSVYRILDFLESENLVHKLSVANQYIACAHISCDHSHASSHFLICRECDKVKEVYLDQEVVDSLTQSLKPTGFQLAGSQLELKCVCDECLTKTKP